MNTGYNNYPQVTSGGPTGGTSIYSLKHNNQYNHNGYHNNHYNQHNQYDQYNQPNNYYQHNTEDSNINNIVNNINTAVNDVESDQMSVHTNDRINNGTVTNYKNINSRDVDNEECYIDENNENEETDDYIRPVKKYKKHSINKKLNFRDPILLWLVYMMLSQGFVKNTIGNYIPVINPNENGVVGIVGISVYGFILVAIYFVLRYIFI